MLSLVSLPLILAILPGHGSRVRRNLQKYGKSNMDTSSGESVNEAKVLRELDAGGVTNQDITVSLVEGLAKVNFSASGWEADLATTMLGVSLSIVHPVMGACFTLFHGMLKKDKSRSNLLQSLETVIDKMITKALWEYEQDVNEANIDGLINQINNPVPVWSDIQSHFNQFSNRIYGMGCWRGDRDECVVEHTVKGGARAYAYAIQWTELMIHSRVRMVAEGYSDIVPNLHEDILNGSTLTLSHWMDWANYRRGDGGFAAMFKAGYCKRKGSGKLGWTYIGPRDLYEGVEFEGPRCRKTGHYYPLSAKKTCEAWLQRCDEDWKAKVDDQVSFMKRQILAIWKVRNQNLDALIPKDE